MGFLIYIILFIIIDAIICAGLAGKIAEEKGYSSGTWGFCGFLFGILGLIAVAGLPSKPNKNSVNESFIKHCPDCKELIKMDAIVCRYCGHRFEEKQVIIEMIKSLKDRNSSIRLSAIDYLRGVKDNSVLPHLVEVLDSADKDFYGETAMTSIRNAATQALIEKNDKSITPLLIEILNNDGSSYKKGYIIKILAELANEEAIHALIKALDYANSEENAENALLKIGGPAIPLLESAANDKSHPSRKAAQRILERINAN